MADLVLALNAGSSTVKFAVFTLEQEPRPLWRGLIDGVGRAPRLRVRDASGTVVDERAWPDEPARQPAEFAGDILDWVDSRLGEDWLAAVSHRICHGGDRPRPIRLTPEALEALDGLAPLAPLHQPSNLAMAWAVALRRPDLAGVGCFDTSFFNALPEPAQCVPVPAEWRARGVRRYGFHGLSYDYLNRKLRSGAPAARRVVFAHLGSGASLCACLDGAPVETTMGFSPLDGLVMSTRCGSLDPGVLLFLMDRGVSRAEAEDMLYRRSGLLAVSGESGDMRTLLASPTPAAAAAVELFVHRVVRETGAMVACLGGLDALAFSGGIGENAPAIRRQVCARLGWLGLELDEAANAAGAERIDAPASKVSVWVTPTDEEATLASGAVEALGLRRTVRSPA